jgi:hypothetical protein
MSRSGCIVTGALAAAALAGGFVLVGGRQVALEYVRLVEPDVLVVEVTTGEVAWIRLAGVDETASTVAITLLSYEPSFIPHSAIGISRQVRVELRQPLGDRLVRAGGDGAVLPVTLCVPPIEDTAVCSRE